MMINRADKLAIASSLVVSLVFWAACIWAYWPDWWQVLHEYSHLTWLHFGLLGSISLLAGANAYFVEKTDHKSDGKWWLLLALGFFYLAWDERLAIHEFLRREILAPRQFDLSFLPWIKTGDYLLFFIMLGGLIVLPKIMALFKDKRLAWRFFLFGVIASALTIILDSINTDTWTAYQNGMWQLMDEIMETVSMLFLVNAVFMMFTYYRKTTEQSQSSASQPSSRPLKS